MDKRLFVGVPTYDGKDYCLDEFAKSVKSLVHPINLCIIDTSKTDKNLKKLRKKFPDASIRHIPLPDDVNVLKFLASIRDIIRNAFLGSSCRRMLMLDSDIMMTNKVLEEMLAVDHPWVGPVSMFGTGKKGKHIDVKPFVFKSGKVFIGEEKQGLDFYTKEELKDMPKQFECHAVSLGCSLVTRRIMFDVPFITCELLAMGEDLWWFNNASEKGYTCICVNKEIKHLTDDWGSFGKQSPLAQFRMEVVTRTGDDVWKKVNLKDLRKKASKELKKPSKGSKKHKKN